MGQIGYSRRFPIRAKSVAKGAGSFVLDSLRASGTGDLGVFDAAGSYAIFMRYVAALGRLGLSFEDKCVVEFGPGASYGMGFAALLCGARRYYAFDLIDHTSNSRNLTVFNSLAAMFAARAPIRTGGFRDKIFPFLDDMSFPSALLPDSLLARTLHNDRLDAIRADLAGRSERFIRARSTAELPAAKIDEPADVIMSESVLEHVDDLKSTYEAFGRWLSRDGVMVHLIDYTSHNLSSFWNGHWACSPPLWAIVRGKRYYLINREPHQYHVDRLKAQGFKVVHADLLRRVDGLLREDFSPEFQGMSYADATTSLASITCQRI